MALNKKKRLPRKTQEENHHLRLFGVADGLAPLPVLQAEIDEYWDVLLGRVPPPIPEHRTDALMETADAYFARASEITAMIQRAEQEGTLVRTSPYVKFRTGELRTFMDVCKRAADMGSRRITMFQIRIEHHERRGRDA